MAGQTLTWMSLMETERNSTSETDWQFRNFCFENVFCDVQVRQQLAERYCGTYLPLLDMAMASHSVEHKNPRNRFTINATSCSRRVAITLQVAQTEMPVHLFILFEQHFWFFLIFDICFARVELVQLWWMPQRREAAHKKCQKPSNSKSFLCFQLANLEKSCSFQMFVGRGMSARCLSKEHQGWMWGRGCRLYEG